MIVFGDRRRIAAWHVSVVAVLVLAAALAFAGSAVAMPSEQPFEIEPGSFHVSTSTNQAGAAEDLTVAFDFTHNSEGKPFNDVRETIVNLPAGFTGNNTAMPTCTPAQLGALQKRDSSGTSDCPQDTQVGTVALAQTLGTKHPVRMTFPVYNMEVQSPGIVAELGFKTLGFVQMLPITVRPGDSGLTVTAPAIASLTEAHEVSVTTWGVPASHVHDAERGQVCDALASSETVECFGGGHSVDIPVKPFLANPTSCGPFTATMQADSWEEPGHYSEAETQVGPIVECERVPFHPSIEVGPTTDSAESSSGLNVSLVVPQNWGFPEAIAASNLKDSTVALPVGYTANPSLAVGLGTCTPQQLEAETFSSLPGTGCPAESKIGTVEVETPVLAEKLGGNIYIATPFDNKFGSLLALYVVVKDPFRGIVVKLQGQIEPNPVTGQLVTTFDDSPQVPFSKFTLKLRQGAASPLISPPACGTYTTEAELSPWSAPLETRHLSSAFQIENGIGGGSCPAGGVPPFKPGILAGTVNNSAGAYSPMDIRITRNDGEQEITRFTSILPPGLTANLTGVPFCPDADIEAAKHVSGAQEEADPACPAASEIGHTLVGAGVGNVLAYAPGKVYMAGPYNGAPFSVVSITSAKVGPFDLGTVVIRFALEINPETGVVTVDAKASDPIPHIIDGIVIHVRDIRVYVDRPNFMINPTNCDPMSFAATVGGGGAEPANPADQDFATVTNSSQMANCQNLAFKPVFKVSTSGKTSRQNGASLSVKLSYPNAPQGTQANIHSVKVDLPKQLPSRLTTLQKACVDSVFNANPAACPTDSKVGTAKAITPILPVPIEGPAYFVSHGGAKFPELIVVLQGYGVTIDLHGETFINKAGITSSTFRSVPDEPVTSFELTLPQGTDSALAANGNLCAVTKTVLVKRKVSVRVKGHKKTVTRNVRTTLPASLTMPIAFTAQNGAVIKQNTPISVIGCPPTRGKAKKAKTTRRGKHKK